MIDTCVCCGEYVPEGQQVCATCQSNPKKHPKIDDKTLQIACINHDEKLNRTYNATSKTLIKL